MFKKNVAGIFMLLILLVLSGCTSTKPVESEASKDKTVIAGADVPAFFLMPPTAEDAYYGVGSAKMSNIDSSKTIALSRARDDISRQVNINVKNAITDYMQESGGNTTQTIKFIETVSRQISETTLHGAKPKELYISKDRTIFALVEYRIADLTNAASDVFKRNEESAYAEFKAVEALKNLDSEIKANPTTSIPVTE